MTPKISWPSCLKIIVPVVAVILLGIAFKGIVSTGFREPFNRLVPDMTAIKSDNAMVCVYPISGQYAFLPRLLFYVLTVFGLVWRHHEWLVTGALAVALTYSGSAAVHAVLLATFRHETALDLDVIPCNAILATSVLVIMPLSYYSESWRITNANVVIVAWTQLVIAGMVCALITFATNHKMEDPCVTVDGNVLTTPQLNYSAAGFGCSYSCFSSKNHLRDVGEIQAMRRKRMDVPIFFKLISLAATLVIFLISWSLLISRCLSSNTRPGPWDQAFKWPWCLLASAFFGLVCITFEYGMQRSPPIPVSEAYQNVGQWAPWVGAALVVIAALLTLWSERRKTILGTTATMQPDIELVDQNLPSGTGDGPPAGLYQNEQRPHDLEQNLHPTNAQNINGSHDSPRRNSI